MCEGSGSTVARTLPRRILYVHHGQVPGGAPTSLRNMVAGIRRLSDHHLKVLCVFPQMMGYFAQLEGVEVERYLPAFTTSGRGLLGMSPLGARHMLRAILSDLAGARRMVRLEAERLAEERPDLVHLNSAILWSTALACCVARVPLIWHVREASMAPSLAPHLLLYGALIRRLADRVVCIGPTEYEKLHGAWSSRVVVVRNSLDRSFFDPSVPSRGAARRALGLPADPFIYLSLGGVNHRKGTYQLVEAARELPDSFMGILAGPAPPGVLPMSRRADLALRLEDLLAELGLVKVLSSHYAQRVARSLAACPPGRLHLAGQIQDVRGHIAASDAVVFADTTSHSGRPVFEAWALKRPVVAFDTPAMRREIQHGRDGLLVSPPEAGALAEALRRLRSDPGLARALGEAGHLKARTLFHPEKNARRILALYDDIWREREAQGERGTPSH